MFKNIGFAILFDMFLNPSFEMSTSFANLARTTASTKEFIYLERFQIISNWVFIWKIMNEVKNSLIAKFQKFILDMVWQLPMYDDLK